VKKEQLYEVLGDINEDYISDAHKTVNKKPHTFWRKWGAMAACLCLVIGLTIPQLIKLLHPIIDGGSTLVGAVKIYPTVMVDGKLYQWRRGSAICSELPDGCVFYGEVTHVKGEKPVNNGEFVSVFAVSGEIYTVTENDDCVYLCLTTDWLNETIVVFDKATNSKSADE